MNSHGDQTDHDHDAMKRLSGRINQIFKTLFS